MKIEVSLKLDEDVQCQLNRIEMREQKIAEMIHALAEALGNQTAVKRITDMIAELKTHQATLQTAVDQQKVSD